MDRVTGPIAYMEAEKLELIEKLKLLRQNVIEKRNYEILETFNGILRALGSEMDRRINKILHNYNNIHIPF